MKETGKRMLLLGVYSMEMVECGGALCKNVADGGVSHASILFAGEKMRQDMSKAAEILGVTVEYLDMDSGAVQGTREEKLKIMRVIRQFRPDIIITQDPEHCLSDLDPGRRPVMTLILEAIALASRDYAVEELDDLPPHGGATIYYMSPSHPNCLVDIADVWEKKCAAMDALESQLEFCGKLYEQGGKGEQMEKLVPGWEQLKTPLEKGRAAKRVFDQAYYLYHGSTGHNAVLFAEDYRREGHFVLDNLLK